MRLAHRGHANRELRRLQLAESPELPATLHDGEREVGRLTSSAGCRRAAPRRSATCGGRSPTAPSWSLWTPEAGALRLGTLVEWPKGARSSGDRAQPCGG